MEGSSWNREEKRCCRQCYRPGVAGRLRLYQARSGDGVGGDVNRALTAAAAVAVAAAAAGVAYLGSCARNTLVLVGQLSLTLSMTYSD